MKKIYFYLLAAGVVFLSAVSFSGLIISADIIRKDQTKKLETQITKENSKEKKLILWQKLILLSPTENNFLKAGLNAREQGNNILAGLYLKRVKTNQGLYELGNNYLEQKDYNKAEATYLKIKPPDNKIKQKLIDLYLNSGQFKKAETICQQGYRTTEPCALIFLALGNYPETINSNGFVFATKIAKMTDQNSRIIGTYFVLRNYVNPQVATIFISDKTEDLKNNRDGNILLGNEAYNQGNYQKSAQYLEKAKNLDPYYPQVYQHLIDVYTKLGQSEKVIEYSNFLNTINWS